MEISSKTLVGRKRIAGRGKWTLYEDTYQRKTGGKSKELILEGPEGESKTTMDAAMSIIEAEGQVELF